MFAAIYSIFIFSLGFALGVGINVLLIKSSVLAFIPILFYRGVAATAIAAVFQFIVISFVTLCLSGDAKETLRNLRVTIVSVTFSIALAFLVVFPVSIDRSVTVFLLGEMEKAGDAGLSETELQTLLINRYVVEFGAVNRRLEEQQYSHFVENSGGKFRLTNEGKKFLRIARVIARLYGTRNQVLSLDEPTGN